MGVRPGLYWQHIEYLKESGTDRKRLKIVYNKIETMEKIERIEHEDRNVIVD